MKLTVAVDVGGSSTKIFYQLSEDEEKNRYRYLLIPPQLEFIREDEFKEYQDMKGWIGHPSPKRDMWLKIGNQVVVLGHLATKFDPKDRLKALKYEFAIYKVLAAIGLIIEEHQISCNQAIRLNLGILLPYNEYRDGQKFQEQLTKMLARYQFRGKTIKVKIKEFLCRPEGGGLAIALLSQNGKEWLREKRVACLMLGHRNVTALNFQEGEMVTAESPLLGFNLFLERVCQLKSGLNPEQLVTALFRARASEAGQEQIYGNSYRSSSRPLSYPDWQSLPDIQKLAMAEDPQLRQKEIEEIHQGILQGKKEYWHKLKQWLDQVLLERLDYVVISGGSAEFLQPDLENYFNCKPYISEMKSNHSKYRVTDYYTLDSKRHHTPIIWGHDLEFEKTPFSKIFDFTSLEKRETVMWSRLVDVHGLFVYLQSKVKVNSSDEKGVAA